MTDGLEASRRRARRNGLASAASPAYISEVAPPESRGRLVSFFQLAVTIGILVAYLVGLAFCWKFVPETKGKRLEDIQGYFQDRVEAGAVASAPPSR
jgi:MFS family permease